MAWKIARIVGPILALAVLAIAMQPAEFAVERSVAIGAPADLVYPHIASVRAMDAWSPWTRMDPQLTVAYEGPESGVGARSAWEGPQMGKGRIAVTAVEPPRSVEMKLEMLAPMAGTNRVLFTLDPAGGDTRVTWRMEGRNGFVGKAASLFFGMDEMVGGTFEKGLAALKTLAEAQTRRNG